MNLPVSESTTPAAGLSAALLAKAALRRLALEKREPTPENYALAYEQEGGVLAAKPVSSATPPEADGVALSTLIRRVVRGVERGSRAWTPARKKDSLQRVLEGSRSDVGRLKHRLDQLLASWEADGVTAPAPLEPGLATVTGGLDNPTRSEASAIARSAPPGGSPGANSGVHVDASPAADPVDQQRERLVEQLALLCGELTASMAELAESDSWVKGQCEAMQRVLAAGISPRALKAVNELLRDTRKRQGALRNEREQARDALRQLVSSMLGSLSELGSQTGRLHHNVERYTEAIEQADTLDSLTLVVREMVQETRSVQGLVAQARSRLEQEHAKVTAMSERVNQLENELRRLSNEVTTDQLTQVANRRGLIKTFDVERARMERGGKPLAAGLLDLDNFKRLNDQLGHVAGDAALKALAALVSETLRATDLVARYGGEEFVVLLPETDAVQAQVILTRLQRKLSSGLFLHEGKDVFVTFSAGVTACAVGESLEQVLERADAAMYEAKRAGKNRTCIA